MINPAHIPILGGMLLVEDFERALAKKIGHEYDIIPYAPGDQIAQLRGTLISEECSEALDELDGCGKGTIDALAKELCDILYVVFGTAVRYNIPLDVCFSRVHENNMLKLNTASIRSDGKLVKPANHPAVDLSDLFEGTTAHA